MTSSTLVENYKHLLNEANLINSAAEFWGPNAWPSTDQTTYANPSNSYADSSIQTPITVDHIFRRTYSPKKVQARTIASEARILKTSCMPRSGKEKEKISYQYTDKCPTVEETIFSLNLTQCMSRTPNRKTSFSKPLNWFGKRLTTDCGSQDMISISDHEAITATITIRKIGSVANKP